MTLLPQKRRLLVKLLLLIIIPVLLLLSFVAFSMLAPTLLQSAWGGGSVVTLVLLYAWFAFGFLKAFTRRFEKTEALSELLAAGKLNAPFHQNGQDEFMTIAKALHATGEDLKNKTAFANHIGTGNLQAAYEPTSPDDQLGLSLLKIKENLLAVKDEDRKRNWTTDGLARFVEVLRTDKNLHELCHDILKNLVALLRANQGTIFIVSADDAGNASLEMQACYAFDRRKYIQKTILPGEGLIGQVFLEKRTTYLKDVPDNFIRITSGLGDASPRFVLLAPLKMNDDVVGVVELASFKAFEQYEIAFVEKIGETIAHNIISFRTAEHTRKLLQDSQEQTEHMRAQEEELRQNQEELQATQEEISRKYSALFRQLTSLNHEAKFDQLKSITSTKKRNIEYYFDIIRSQIVTYAENKMVIEAMQAFASAFGMLSAGNKAHEEESVKHYYVTEFMPRLRDNVARTDAMESFLPPPGVATTLQYLFISSNPYPTGQKSLMIAPRDARAYGQVHVQYHPTMLSFLEKFGYYDIFLIDPGTGNIVYSVFKEVDFGTSLLTGRYRDTNFGRVVKAAIESTDKRFVKLVDFEPYAPSYHAPASFIACPIYDHDKKVGILVFQMPINKINQILTGDNHWREDGLGDTGETYLVGHDRKLRSIARDLVEDRRHYLAMLKASGYDENAIHMVDNMNTSILVEQRNLTSIGLALDGQSGTLIETDTSGEASLNAYAPLSIPDVQWVILSSMKEQEASQRINELRKQG